MKFKGQKVVFRAKFKDEPEVFLLKADIVRQEGEPPKAVLRWDSMQGLGEGALVCSLDPLLLTPSVQSQKAADWDYQGEAIEIDREHLKSPDDIQRLGAFRVL